MKNRKAMMLGSTVLAGILAFSLYGMGRAIASSGYDRDDDDRHDSGYREGRYSRMDKNGGPENALYVEECGSCHMAYPAQLLPVQSWRKMMEGLEDHFGENAELDGETRAALTTYLSKGSRPERGEYRKMFRNQGDNAPLRITELSYFVDKHDEIPLRMIDGNDKVGSLSRCDACHQNAVNGGFDEDDVVIPGFGRWDD